MHPALLDVRTPPVHVRDGERHAARAREHHRTRRGTPAERALPRRSAPALACPRLHEHHPLGLVGIAERTVDHRIDDAALRQRLEDAPCVPHPRPPRLCEAPAGVLVDWHPERVRVAEHRLGDASGIAVLCMDQVPPGVLGEERDRVERHGHGTTASSAGLRGS